ncbi:hypothetical protein ACFV6F_18135 [Kitasatospora phosalacinea]|uniref:hypothetical protein n=1 Tax=Kitasatospora phosalacinea TaxID=2065 RepID=UPI00365B4CB2
MAKDESGDSGREGTGAKLIGIAAVITALGTVLGIVLGQGGDSHEDAKADPPAASASPSAPAAAPASTPVAASTAPAGTPSAAATGGDDGAVANGSQIGTYSLHVPGGYGVPLTTAAPKIDDYEQGEAGDVYVGGEAQAFSPSGQNKLIPLKNGTAPTYSACTTAGTFVQQVPTAPGTAFCISAPGRMIGIRVTAAHTVNVPFWAEAQATVWQNAG